LQLPDWLTEDNRAPTQEEAQSTRAGDNHMIATLAAPSAGTAWPHTPLTSTEQQELIQASWQRSRQAGLLPDMAPDFTGASAAHVKTLLDECRQLGTLAYPVLQALYEQIANTHSVVVLTDGVGRILHSLGDDTFLDQAEKVAIKPGVDWSERAKGTNAIGTAIALGLPLTIHADQHYLKANSCLTCSSTPIFNPQGHIVGVLDVTGDARGYHRHTMALARMSAQIIENQIFSETYQDTIRLHFHSRPEFIGTLFEGVVAFSRGGRFLAANRGALFQLGQDLPSLQRNSLSSLFGISVDELIDHCRSASPQLLSLALPNGVTVRAKADVRTQLLWQAALSQNSDNIHVNTPSTSATGAAGTVDIAAPHDPKPSYTASASETATAQMLAAQRRDHMSSLRYLDTGDPQVAAVIQKLRRVQGYDIPILILGETGVGKELLAKAVHNDSARSRHPFIAVNCASIPESLIEAELFGYEEGAFTGARRKGAMGKIQMANGGTLFLDEIGDMPLMLQTRLLRTLQERVISPLGSNRSIPVNFAVISATHRNLRQMIAQGQFREDLYYRLNGLALRLPALRERTDLDTIVHHLLKSGCDGGAYKRLAEAVRQLFAQYPWPGNVRQLTNVLRTACVLSGQEPVIELEHLPDDFTEEAQALILSNQAATLASAGAGAGQPTSAMPAASNGPSHAYSPPLNGAQATPGAPVGGAGSPTRSTGEATPWASEGYATPLDTAWMGKGLQEVEIQAITQALARCDGNVSAAARMLGVSRNTIYRKVPELAQKKD
jgi:transcriptional regulator of acetoin/glycerol metabolism